MRSSLQKYLKSKRLRDRLFYIHRNKSLPGEFEDFYQSYCVHVLEGKGKHQTLDQYAIDYLRQHIGRNNDLKKNLFNASELQREMSLDKNSLEQELVVNSFIDTQRGSKRVLAILCLKYGFSNEELAYVYNVSASRISQVMSEVKKEFGRDCEGVYGSEKSVPEKQTQNE